jgi:hypothetical protein
MLRRGHFFDAAYGIQPVLAAALPVQLHDEVRQWQLPRFLPVIVELAELLWVEAQFASYLHMCMRKPELPSCIDPGLQMGRHM